MAPTTFIFQTPADGHLATLPDTADLAIIAVDAIPYLARSLELRAQARWTPASILNAQQAIRITIVSMLLNLKRDLTEPTNQLYRLLDSVYNGTRYTATPSPIPNTPDVIAPLIPSAPPDLAIPMLPVSAFRQRVERLVNLVDNLTTGTAFSALPTGLSQGALSDAEGLRATVRALQGELNAGWFGIGGQHATLADIVTALKVGDKGQVQDIQQVFDALDTIGDGAEVIDTVADVLGNTAEAAEEGGILAILLTASVGTIAMLSLLSQQLTRLMKAIDGGGMLPPSDNVLTAINRVNTGTTTLGTEIVATRTALLNRLTDVIAAINTDNNLAPYIDDVEALLKDIRAGIQ